jgi:hypothetical protein
MRHHHLALLLSVSAALFTVLESTPSPAAATKRSPGFICHAVLGSAVYSTDATQGSGQRGMWADTNSLVLHCPLDEDPELARTDLDEVHAHIHSAGGDPLLVRHVKACRVNKTTDGGECDTANTFNGGGERDESLGTNSVWDTASGFAYVFVNLFPGDTLRGIYYEWS